MDNVLSNVPTGSVVAAMGNSTREVMLLDSDLNIVASSNTINYNVSIDCSLLELSDKGRISRLPSGLGDSSVGEINPFQQVIANRETLTNKYIITGKHGGLEYISISGEPLSSDAITELGLFSVDLITREKGLKEERDRLRTIVEAVGDPIYVCDNEPKFTYVNDAFAKLTGYTKERLINSHPNLIKPHDSQQKIRQTIRDILSDGEPNYKTVEVEITTKDGDHILCEDHVGALLDDDGEFIGAAGALRDISKRKKRSSQLQDQRDQLEQFTSILTHDLRNPLGIIKGYAKQIKTPDNAEEVERVEQAVSRMQDIIDDTLALYEEGGDLQEYEVVSLESVANKAWDSVDTGKSEIDVQDRVMIKGDSKRMVRLFENLYRNAIEHNDNPVVIEVGKYSAIGTTTRETCEGFYIADSGSGIDRENREKVFDFGETSSSDGTGLGLPIVKRVAEAHGWEIDLFDSKTGGAKFVFTGIEFASD